MTDPETKSALFDEFALVAKAVANGRRAEMIDVLANGERSVEALAREVRQSVANTSQHLQILKEAGLVTARRDGNRILYRLASPEVARFWRSLQNIARQRRAEVERLVAEYLGPADTEAVTREELWARLQRGAQVVLLDVRPPDEYRAGHLPGAVSIPLEELEARLDEVPTTGEVVAYCRGPLCALAPRAARLLRDRGYRVKRLEDGVAEWEGAGLPVDRAER